MKIVNLLLILVCMMSITHAKILVVVESAYYNNQSPEVAGKERVSRYIKEVNEIDNKKVGLLVYTNLSSGNNLERVSDLWYKLVKKYNTSVTKGDPIDGIVLIGDLPVPALDGSINSDEERVSMDYIYMELYDNYNNVAYSGTSDLKTIWTFDKRNNFFKSFYPNRLKTTYEAWVSRIYAANLNYLRAPGDAWGDFLTEHEIISRYLDKVHTRMTSPAKMPSRGMAMGHVEEFYDHLSQSQSTVAAYKDLMQDILAFEFVPVSQTYFYNKFDGEHRINSSSNWQSQLQAGPYGNVNKGLFNQSIDNRFQETKESDDTLGYEWAAFYEHGNNVTTAFNNVKDLTSGVNGRGSVHSYTPLAGHDGLWYHPHIEGGYQNNKYYTVHRDEFPNEEYYDPKMMSGWMLTDLKPGTYELYFWVDVDMIPEGCIYTKKSTYVNVKGHKYDAVSNDYIVHDKDEGRFNIKEWVDKGNSKGWARVIEPYILTIDEAHASFSCTFHPFVETHLGPPDNLLEVFPISAMKFVNTTTSEEVICNVDDNNYYVSSTPAANDRFLLHMQEDGGQSKAHFFYANSCQVANILNPESIMLTYAMGHGGLISLGSSSTNWTDRDYKNFTNVLNKDGFSIGDAYLNYLNKTDHYYMTYQFCGAGNLKAEAYTAFRDLDGDFTQKEMLDFSWVGAWHIQSDNVAIEWVEALANTMNKNLKITMLGSNWIARLQAKKPITAFKNKSVENIKMGLKIAFPKEAVNPITQLYRGNLQLYRGNNWFGQFEINSKGEGVALDEQAQMYEAYYELSLPSDVATAITTDGLDLELRFSAVNPGEWFILKSIDFYEIASEKEYVLDEQIQDVAEKYGNKYTVQEIKTKAQPYDNGLSSESLYDVYYRDVIDTIDGKLKRFYYRVGYDDDMSMLFVNWWAFQEGYNPLIPWATECNAWRQAWLYLGCEIL